MRAGLRAFKKGFLFSFCEIAKLTVRTNADVTSGMVHAGAFSPLFRHRIEASHRTKVLVAIESADHVNEIVQGAQSMISPRCYIRVHRYKPSVSSKVDM